MLKNIIVFMAAFFLISGFLAFGQDDYGISIVQADDGGYVFLGYSKSYTFGHYDFLIYKLDSSGNKVWRKHYGGALEDYGRNIQKTSDGGYLICGQGLSYTNGGSDILIYKLDSDGNKQWRRSFGGTSYDGAFSCGETADGGYFAFGTSYSYSHGVEDFILYKLDSSGNKVWRKHYGGSGDERGAVALNIPSDGGYILLGESNSYTFGEDDLLIYRLDSSGNKIWRKHYGGSGDEGVWDWWPSGKSLVQTADGGFVFCGFSKSYSYGNWDIIAYKIDSGGNKVWRKNYGGADEDQGYAIQQTSDGGYIIAGSTVSYTYGSYDFILFRLDSMGNKIWRKNYGGSNSDSAMCIKQVTDEGYVVSGFTRSYVYTPGKWDFLLYKLDSAGNKVWRKHFGK